MAAGASKPRSPSKQRRSATPTRSCAPRASTSRSFQGRKTSMGRGCGASRRTARCGSSGGPPVHFCEGHLGHLGHLGREVPILSRNAKGIFAFCWGFRPRCPRCPSEVPVKAQDAQDALQNESKEEGHLGGPCCYMIPPRSEFRRSRQVDELLKRQKEKSRQKLFA